jgi:16S rRNA (cytidine1402-2'-O)-methyltransferase
MKSYSIRKLYLIPTTMGDCDPMDVLPQTVKRTIDFIDYYIVENEKQLVNQSKKYIQKRNNQN